jgi:hypothetical protein
MAAMRIVRFIRRYAQDISFERASWFDSFDRANWAFPSPQSSSLVTQRKPFSRPIGQSIGAPL